MKAIKIFTKQFGIMLGSKAKEYTFSFSWTRIFLNLTINTLDKRESFKLHKNQS